MATLWAGKRRQEVAQAIAHLEARRYAEAESLLRGLAGRYPRDSQIHKLLFEAEGLACIDRAEEVYQRGGVAEAEHDLNELAARFPAEPEPHLRLAAMLVSARREGVNSHLERALELAPDDPWVLFRAARVAYSCGDRRCARAIIARIDSVLARQDVVVRHPFGEAVPLDAVRQTLGLDAEISYMRGGFALEDNDPVGAIEIWSQALQERPEIRGLGADLACLHLERGEIHEAHSALNRAIRARPDDDRLHALVEQTQGKPES